MTGLGGRVFFQSRRPAVVRGGSCCRWNAPDVGRSIEVSSAPPYRTPDPTTKRPRTSLSFVPRSLSTTKLSPIVPFQDGGLSPACRLQQYQIWRRDLHRRFKYAFSVGRDTVDASGLSCLADDRVKFSPVRTGREASFPRMDPGHTQLFQLGQCPE